MPGVWKFAMAVLVVCLVASMAIAIYRLATTPTQVGIRELRGLPSAPRR